MSWELLFMCMIGGFYTAALVGLIFMFYFRAKLDYTARIVMAMSETLEKIKELRRQKEDTKKC